MALFTEACVACNASELHGSMPSVRHQSVLSQTSHLIAQMRHVQYICQLCQLWDAAHMNVRRFASAPTWHSPSMRRRVECARTPSPTPERVRRWHRRTQLRRDGCGYCCRTVVHTLRHSLSLVRCHPVCVRALDSQEQPDVTARRWWSHCRCSPPSSRQSVRRSSSHVHFGQQSDRRLALHFPRTEAPSLGGLQASIRTCSCEFPLWSAPPLAAAIRARSRFARYSTPASPLSAIALAKPAGTGTVPHSTSTACGIYSEGQRLDEQYSWRRLCFCESMHQRYSE